MKKFLGILFLVIVLVNLILFSLNKIKPIVFWFIILLCFIVAYKIIPRLK